MEERPAFIKQETSVEAIVAFTRWLRAHRPELTAPLTQAGANMTIILNAACIVDGCLEWILREEQDRRHNDVHRAADAVPERRDALKAWANRVNHVMHESTLRRTHGIGDDTKQIFQMTTGRTLPELLGSDIWEGVRTMFSLRNAIAHGRMVRGEVSPSATHPAPMAIPTAGTIQQWSGAMHFGFDGQDDRWAPMLRGSFQNVERYLRKRNVTTSGFLDNADRKAADVYYTDDVADHFWRVARTAVERLAAVFGDVEPVREQFDRAL